MAILASICVATIATIIYRLGRKLYNFYLYHRRLNELPGPEFALPFIGFFYNLLKVPKEDRLDWSEKLSAPFKDGFIRIWTGTTGNIEIQKPEHVEVILGSNTQITKSRIYDYLTPWLGRGLLTSSGPRWFHDRKLITPAFHFGILEDFSEVMIEKANILNNCIEREMKIHGNEPFDIFDLCLRCALDVVCETAMGVNVHAQEEFDNEYIKAVKTIASASVFRFNRPWLMWDWIFYGTATGKAFESAVETSHTYCTEVIRRKLREPKLGYADNGESKRNDETGERKKKVFLDLLLEANEKDDDPLTFEEISYQTNTFMFTGHDTVGVLVGWTLFSLGNNTDVQTKVHEELDRVLGDSDDRSTLKQLPNLKYLDRVIKEVLRLYPSVATVSRFLTKDTIIGDYTVPKDTTVSVEIYKLHRDPSVWPDPLRFDPDRFLPENAKSRHHHAYIPFSAGPRNCIGQKYATLEAKVVVVQVLRKFTVVSVEKHSTIKKKNEIVLQPVDGIYVRVKGRRRIVTM